MPVSKLFLYSAVETLQVAIRLGMAGVVEVVSQVLFAAGILKVFEELMAVISLYSANLKRHNASQFLKKIPGAGRRAGLIGVGEGKSGRQIDGRQEIAFDTIYENINRIYLHQVAWKSGIETFSSQLLRRLFFPDYHPTGSAVKADLLKGRKPAAFLEVVDNQLRENNPPETKETLERLMAEGYSVERAKELIAQVVAVESYAVMKTKTTFNRERFVRNLMALPQEPKE